jgi:hypothetical protein
MNKYYLICLLFAMWWGLGSAQTDQELTYSTLLGGNSFDSSRKLHFDQESGIIHFIAISSSFNFPIEGSSHQSFNSGEEDVVYGRIDMNGNLIYSTYFGGNDYDSCNGIDTENNGNIILGGNTSSSDFPILNGSLSTYTGSQKGWLAKFNSEDDLLWSTYVGGSSDFDGISDLVVNSAGEIFIVGGTQSTDLGTEGTYQVSMLDPGIGSSYIAKYDQNGFPIWFSYISDDGSPSIEEIALSHDETSVYVIGTSGGELPFSNSNHQQENGGGSFDAILFSFDAEEGTLNWGTYYGGEGSESGYDVETSENGAIVISGRSSSFTNIATPGALNEELNAGAIDGFIAAFSDSGTRLWATYLGSNSFDGLPSFLAIRGDYIYLSATTSSDLLPIIGANPLVPFVEGVGFGTDVGYIAKINLDGSYVWSTYSNPDYECANCRIIEATDTDRFYCLGTFPGQSNNPECIATISPDAYQTEYGGGNTDMALFIYNDNTLSTSFPKAESLNIYPNPAQDLVTIEAPHLLWAGMELTVTDISGRQVDRVARFQSGNTYSTGHLSDGVYILTGQIGKRMFREKLVVNP